MLANNGVLRPKLKKIRFGYEVFQTLSHKYPVFVVKRLIVKSKKLMADQSSNRELLCNHELDQRYFIINVSWPIVLALRYKSNLCNFLFESLFINFVILSSLSLCKLVSTFFVK